MALRGGAGAGFRWGRCAACGRASGLRGCGRRAGEGRVAVRGREKAFGGECVVGAARNVSRSLRACVWAAWGSESTRAGRVAVLGREQIFGEEWVVGSAGLTHFRRSGSRARVLLLYVRRATAVKSRPWGRKTPPTSTHRPRRLPHPPRLRLYFRAGVHLPPHTLWPPAE